ncbi:hypothetical protein BD847_2537 [Flavobacterium cutihirudinis]|uniref:NlpE-like protein n=1 Tax=Flavobacterium cutihirudinis TaxID=1265740 RepID=A0A3D9FSN2_9FLAO|nr:hypothetical protein [Flavobacterium cutihirudinis]RED23480.1 hypothetical protein BD847_2537 [Flavobacterium cutihirudinis]
MKPTIILLILALFSTQVNFAQTFDAKLISKDSEINLTTTQKRGIEKNGTLYFVEKDLQTISAYKNNKLLWQTNVITICGKPKVGEPKIRYLKYKTEKLFVTIGKHDYAEVDAINGKTSFLGVD